MCLLFRLSCVSVLLCAALLAAPRQAHAVETFHSCVDAIDTVPAVVSTQGVWCLQRDLATAITSGAAITIATNNVTIDCNGFKLGGLAAGPSSQATGILASGRQNVVVRNCNIRGFAVGIQAQGGAGHLFEDNRLDNNLLVGIYLDGQNSVLRRNRVFDTGGGVVALVPPTGIMASADILDNVVSGVFGTSTPYGILATGSGAGVRISGNRVGGLLVDGAGSATGILAPSHARIEGNHVAASPAVAGTGIAGGGTASTFCIGNTVMGFATGISACTLVHGNAWM